MKLTKKDMANFKKYAETKPRQLGDLHERMRYVLEIMSRKYSGEGQFGDVLWQAVWDLATEVAFYEPKKPPFGTRDRVERP